MISCDLQVRPVDRRDAAVAVEIVKSEATNNLPDITVRSRPVTFEFRNQTLLQAVDYIDRCVIGSFTPLRPPGGKPTPQPLWRVHVPSATMLMPTNDEGSGMLEFLIGAAYVGNEVCLRWLSGGFSWLRITSDCFLVASHCI